MLSLSLPLRNSLLLTSLTALCLGLLSGCASMTRDGSSQTVLIRSEPPGATIYRDRKVVGRTPELVEIDRGVHPEIAIDTANGRETFVLPTKYRWKKSFASGFIFLTYAPIAWAIDLLTGTAWDVEDTDPIPVTLAKADQIPKPGRVPLHSTISPPRSTSVAMSDEGGRALEARLRKKFAGGTGYVRPYDETLPIFIEQDFEFGTTNKNARRRLQKALQADYIYESSITQSDDGWLLTSEVHDVYNNTQTPGPALKLGRDELGPRVFGVGFGLKPWWSRVLPDTIGLDFVNEAFNVELNSAQYQLTPVHGEEWWATGLRYISAINISSTPDRRREFGTRWEFSAIPSLTLSRKFLKVRGLVPTSGMFLESEPEFERWTIAGGYGLEVGYLFDRHYIYLDIVPLFNWSQIAWRQNSANRHATRTALTARSEFGYTYVFDSNWLMRLFVRTQSENIELWGDAFVSRLGNGYAPTSAQAAISGITIGYRFDDRYQAR